MGGTVAVAVGLERRNATMQRGKKEGVLASEAHAAFAHARATSTSRQPTKPPPLRAPSPAQLQSAARRGEGPEEGGPSDGNAGAGGDAEEPSLGALMKVMSALASKVDALDQNVRDMQQQQQQLRSNPGGNDVAEL